MLTRAGAACLVLGPLLAVAAWCTGFRQLTVLAGAALAAVGCAFALTRRPRVRVSWKPAAVQVVEGAAVSVWVEVTNTSRVRSGPVMLVQEAGDAQWSIAVPGLRRGRTYRESVQVTGARRGVFEGTHAYAHRMDPLGLIRRSARVAAPLSVVVAPRTVLVTPLPQISAESSDSARGRRGGGTSFHTLREYLPGDDLRLVHWPTSARQGELIVRETVATPILRHIVVLDTRCTEGEEVFEEAVRVCASIVRAEVRRRQVWLLPLSPDGSTSTAAARVVRGSEGFLMEWLARMSSVSGPLADSVAGVRCLGRLFSAAESAVTLVTTAPATGSGAASGHVRRFTPPGDALFTTVVVTGRVTRTRPGSAAGGRLVIADLDAFAQAWTRRWAS